MFEGNSQLRGEMLEDIRKQKIELTDELISMLEGYNLDYIIPRNVTLPITGSQVTMPKKRRGQNISIGGNTTITTPSQPFGNSLSEMLHGE